MRSKTVNLDHARLLTRGSSLDELLWLPFFQSVRNQYTSVVRGQGKDATAVGQMVYGQGERSGHLTFVTPDDLQDLTLISSLMEHMAWKAGDAGAFNLLAEVEDSSRVFEALRRSGFSVYGWQQVWRLPSDEKNGDREEKFWQPSTELDENAIRGLYQSLVPPLVQGAESFLCQAPNGLVYRQGGDVLAFVEATSGMQGIFLQPIIHPEVKDPAALIRDLVSILPGLGRPVYLAVRSYQAWLEASLSEINAVSTPRQSLLVKHLVMQLRSAVPSRLTVLERRRAESPSPLVNNVSNIHDQNPVN
jgi:hypothetical protein